MGSLETDPLSQEIFLIPRSPVNRTVRFRMHRITLDSIKIHLFKIILMNIFQLFNDLNHLRNFNSGIEFVRLREYEYLFFE